MVIGIQVLHAVRENSFDLKFQNIHSTSGMS